MEVFDCGAVLFECLEGEFLQVSCKVDRLGCLEIVQVSEGPLTVWSFEESPHRIAAKVSSAGTQQLLDYFHLEYPWQLPMVLRLEYTGFDCFLRIRRLMRRLGISYKMQEEVIVR